MKKTVKFLSVIIAAVIIVALVPLSASALNVEDWKIVTYDGTTKDHAKLSVTENGCIRFETEGHYPTTYAGLVYTQPLNVKNGVSLDVTIEELTADSPDVWFSVQLLSKPVCFDPSGSNEGKGLWFLQRPHLIYYNIIGGLEGGTQTPDDLEPGKSFYEPGTQIHYDFKVEDGEFNVYIDGVKCACDFTPVLDLFEDGQCYIGFSTSETNLTHQSFVINYVNGELPASEGHIEDTGGAVETEEPIDFENVDSFTLMDFTDPNCLKKIGSVHDCKIEFDEIEGCLKVTVTGEDPRFNIPMTKARYFDGEKFSVLRMTYKTDVECESGFYFTTQTVPSEAYCFVIYDLYAAPEFDELVIDMDENSNWLGQVRSLRIDPNERGESGQVFYYKNIVMEVYQEEETTPRVTEPTNDTEPDTSSTSTAEPGTTASAVTTDKPNDDNKQPAKSFPWVWIIVSVVAVAVIAAVIMIILKKKK